MGTAGAKALRQGCAGRFQEQEEAGVLGAAPEVKCGSGRWGVGGGARVQTVLISTVCLPAPQPISRMAVLNNWLQNS